MAVIVFPLWWWYFTYGRIRRSGGYSLAVLGVGTLHMVELALWQDSFVALAVIVSPHWWGDSHVTLVVG